MTDRFKGFLVTLEKEIREDDAEPIMNALRCIKGVRKVEPYINGAEDLMAYSNGYYDAKKEIWEMLRNNEKTKL